jgi:hypothetical protein
VLARLGKESTAIIAQNIGVSRQRIYQKLKELGISHLLGKKTGTSHMNKICRK